MKKKLIFISGSLILVLFGAGIYTSIIKLPFTSTMHASWAFDVSNVGLLVKYSDNVFIGRVVKQVGNEGKENRNTPYTQFSVEVLANIKGNLTGTVVVNQMGGYKYGVLHVLRDDAIVPEDKAEPGEYLLQPGHVYMFATKYNKEKMYHQVSAFPYDQTRISTDPTLPNDVALAAAWEHPRVRAFVEAVERGEQDTAVLMGLPPRPTDVEW